MRRVLLGLAAIAASGVVPAWGQMHAVKKPDEVVRAVAVYEWTGEEGKPTASRIVPVSLFIDGQYQDAAIYMARPVPFAIDTGTVYEVRKAGIDAGTLELVYERHLTSGDTAEIDDGWLGYGEFKLNPREPLIAKKQSGPLPKLIVSGKETASDSGGPKLVSRSGSTGDTGSSSASRGSASGQGVDSSGVDANDDDSSSPTLHRRAGSEGDSTTAASAPTASTSAPAASGGGEGQSTAGGSATTASNSSASSTNSDDDADRPTLKRRTPAEIKANKKQKDSARVVAGNDLNDDPDRPTLHRGSKIESQEEEVPPLRGLPKDMKQLVAVSDAKDRPEHDFARQWESSDERSEVLGKMQGFARAQLAEYKGVGPAVPAPAAAPAAATPAASTKGTSAAARAARRKAAAAAAAAAKAAPPAPLPLNDESLKGYTLSYGGAATYVYTATSPGVNGISRYVSVVAQEEPITGLKVALASVTDSSHLDRTPWMRFIDVVDADASNRASLLMELRAQHTRQFALYRVIGAQADQVFLSGSTE